MTIEVAAIIIGVLCVLALAALSVVERMSDRAHARFAKGVAEWHGNGGRL